MTEPSAYEWAPLGDGGIHYDEDNERDMSAFFGTEDADNDNESPEEEEDGLLDGLQIHEYNWGDLSVQTEWTRFDYATEGHGGIASLMREVARKKAAGEKRPNKRPPKEPF
ncbi:hypothetical protein [Taklimakanibacter deserti]|uniref:hypothetical protein n=1 Tax=Taklimakanibacter deserti TaxID=2267839 RepID=UPI000E659482